MKRHEAKLENVASVKAEWKGFGELLTAEMDAADKAMSEAESAANLEEMKKINKSASPLSDRLVELWYKIEGCEKQITQLRNMKLGKVAHEERKELVSKAELQLSELDASLSKAEPESAETAKSLADAAVKEVIGLSGELRTGLRRFKKKKKKAS